MGNCHMIPQINAGSQRTIFCKLIASFPIGKSLLYSRKSIVKVDFYHICPVQWRPVSWNNRVFLYTGRPEYRTPVYRTKILYNGPNDTGLLYTGILRFLPGFLYTGFLENFQKILLYTRQKSRVFVVYTGPGYRTVVFHYTGILYTGKIHLNCRFFLSCIREKDKLCVLYTG